MSSKFKKLPIIIEANQTSDKIVIYTREGTLYAYPGDWIITGIEGEVYPCGKEIFQKTYIPCGDDKCNFCENGCKFINKQDDCEGFVWKK